VEEIEFDPVKEAENLRKHRLPFRAALLLFDGPFIEEEDRRRDYSETRFIATGPIAAFGDRVFVVIYTWRDNARRIISFRRANDREVRRYRQGVA
jgi:uncharacterized DUF497 family protein